MCVITINLSNISTPQNTVVNSASGRYRNITAGTPWVSFSIPTPLTNAYNINPTVLGEYELEVTITNNVGVASLTAKSNFSVATECGGADMGVVEYKYGGIYTRGDEQHNRGGSVTYLDENNIETVREYIWEGDCVTIRAIRIINRQGVTPNCE